MSDSATPLGDDFAPPRPAPTKGKSGLLAGLAGGVVGAGGSILVLKVAPGLGEATLHALRAQLGGWTLPVIIPLSVLLILLVIAVHEAGHVAGGLAVGMRFSLFVVGPLRIERETRKRLTVSLNRSLGMWGGLASCLPATTDRLTSQLAALVAGGPLASILLAAAAGAAAFTLPMPALARFAVGMTAAMSAAIGAATLIPMRSGGFMSDGGRLLRLLRGGPKAEREAATLALITRMTSGEAARDWPREVVDSMVRLRDDSLEESMAWTMAYYHHLDRGDHAAAARALDRAMSLLDRWPAPLAPAMHVEAAYFAAISGDLDAARSHMAEVPAVTASVKQHERSRALAAIALAEGDLARAVEFARQGLARLPEHSAFAAARLNEIIRIAHAAGSQPRHA